MRSLRSTDSQVAIVGAGPFGLSLAAHLRLAGIRFRIFGVPMQTWHTEMPRGMKLKSDGFASNLDGGSDPYTLAQFCAETGRPYHDTDIAVDLETFQAYGDEFARRRVPSLEHTQVDLVERDIDRFRIHLANGETVYAANVVLATGLSGFAYIPRILRGLTPGVVTHTSQHTEFAAFAGKDVVVLGRGASSLNAAALARHAGANVTLLSRHGKVRFHTSSVGVERSLYGRLLHPRTPVGSSLRSWLISNAPQFVHAMPEWMRQGLAFKHLGPSGGYWLHDQVMGKIPILAGWRTDNALMRGKRVELSLRSKTGETLRIDADHIIAGTGFRYDLKRLKFLPADLHEQILAGKAGGPRLSRHFESSVNGLFFAGPAAAPSFGQMLRFVAGAGFAAEVITRAMVRKFEKKLPAPNPFAAPFAPQRRLTDGRR